MKFAIVISIFSLMFCTVCNADVPGLLEQVAKAYGGQESIAAAVSFRQSGNTYSAMRKTEGNITRAYRYPDHLRIEIQYGANASELRILAGPQTWKDDQPQGEPFYSAMLLQAARLGIPAILFEHQQQLRDIGTIDGIAGKKLNALELKFHGNLRLVAGIDPESGRILESHGIIQMNGNEMKFSTTYADFQMQDGHLFAFEEGHYAMGNKTGYTHLQRIEVTPDIPDDLFHPQGQEPGAPEIITAISKGYQGYYLTSLP